MSTPENKEDSSLLHVIVDRMDYLHTDINEMKLAMKDLASAIVKLALVEERQGQAALQMERAFNIMEKLEGRIVALEVAAPMQKQTSLWVMTGVWGAAGVLALFILKQLGVL